LTGLLEDAHEQPQNDAEERFFLGLLTEKRSR
jgi:hypothetical protein